MAHQVERLSEEKLRKAADPSLYGSKGQTWHPAFVEYMAFIVGHENYAGMPDALKPDGKIQWEAPSNRKGGAYQNTHHHRRDWWRRTAARLEIDTSQGEWISQAAKRLHPTGRKPCKRCGREMRLAYVYPNGVLIGRIARYLTDFAVDPLEEIGSLVKRIIEYSSHAAVHLPKILKARDIDVPDLGPDVVAWNEWLERHYIPREPSLLSPGAMSNAPDRFDGFHSFNLCCRKKADTGRHDSNMRLYATDRRVFEFWNDGDWIAANALMGIVNARFRDEPSQDGGDGPPSADHVGPLSLGFCHRPEFLLLSKSANSAKNNRLRAWDVQYLRDAEKQKQVIASWYAQPLWDRRKFDAVDDETALRLSKLLRDNQRNAMALLHAVMDAGHYAFLTSLLGLGHADYNVEFKDLRVVNFVTKFGGLTVSPRETKYAVEQKARCLRIAFSSLHSYVAKENRHTFNVLSNVPSIIERVGDELAELPEPLKILDRNIARCLTSKGKIAEEKLRDLVRGMPSLDCPQFSTAIAILTEEMERVAEKLSSMWSSDRYVRGTFNFE